MKYISLYCIQAFLSLGLFSQVDIELQRFIASRVNNEVVLTWTLEKGSICNGIRIYRSADSLAFDDIGNIEGICGSNDRAETYSHIDNSPLPNQKNYYKLGFGTSGESHVIAFEYIDLGSDGLNVFPNPMTDNTRIYFENSTGQLHELNLFTVNGQLVRKMNTSESYFSLKKGELQTGMYLFTITPSGEGERIDGKLMVGG